MRLVKAMLITFVLLLTLLALCSLIGLRARFGGVTGFLPALLSLFSKAKGDPGLALMLIMSFTMLYGHFLLGVVMHMCDQGNNNNHCQCNGY